MKKIISFFVNYWKILVIILAVLLLAGGGYWYYQIKLSLKVYNDQGLYIKYPKDWQIYTDKIMDVDKHLSGANTVNLTKNKRQSTNVGIDIKEVKGNELNISDSIKALDEKNQKLLDDFEKVYSKEIKIDNISAIDYEFKYSLKVAGTMGVVGKWSGQQRQVIFVKNNKLYTLIFTAEPQDFARDNKDFNKILNSFKFL
jgi:hypothetical protein